MQLLLELFIMKKFSEEIGSLYLLHQEEKDCYQLSNTQYFLGGEDRIKKCK